MKDFKMIIQKKRVFPLTNEKVESIIVVNRIQKFFVGIRVNEKNEIIMKKEEEYYEKNDEKNHRGHDGNNDGSIYGSMWGSKWKFRRR